MSKRTEEVDQVRRPPRGLRFLLARRPETLEEWVTALVGAGFLYGCAAVVAVYVGWFAAGWGLPRPSSTDVVAVVVVVVAAVAVAVGVVAGVRRVRGAVAASRSSRDADGCAEGPAAGRAGAA